MWAQAIGAAIQVGASIYGGIKASQAMKKAQGRIEASRQKNQAWYDRRYNEDATQRADAQRVLTRTEEAIRQRNRQAAGTAAVMGGTEESVAATKAANNEAMADAVSRITAQGDARKDAIEQQYLQRDQQLDNELTQMEMARAQEITKAAQGVAQAGATIGGSGMSFGK